MRRGTAKTIQLADAVIVLGRDMRERLLREYPHFARASRIEVIPPWSDATDLRTLDKRDNPLARQLGVADTFNIVYSGNLGIAHDTDTLLAAMETMSNDPELRWIFIGSGKRLDVVKARAEKSRWKRDSMKLLASLAIG